MRACAGLEGRVVFQKRLEFAAEPGETPVGFLHGQPRAFCDFSSSQLGIRGEYGRDSLF